MEVLNRKEFDLLVDIENRQEYIWSNADAAYRLFSTEEEIVERVETLRSLRFVDRIGERLVLTQEAYVYLEPYKVKRAILLAAGLGSRMQPITLTTPKPLVTINGKIIIETTIDALLEKGINDITIVTGYLGDKFEIIKEKYPNIKFLHNTKFNEENNISSAMLVKGMYSNAYVMDADLYLTNRDIIRKYEYASNYIGIRVAETDDWHLVVDDGKVKGMEMKGKNTYLMVGVSFWSMEAGENFNRDIVELYNREGGKKCYWDDVVLTYFNDHYDIYPRECRREDIVEVDSIEELVAVDPTYAPYLYEK